MFTGIVEKTGILKDIITTGGNKSFWIESSISNQLKVDQSLAHNGVCLTVEEVKDNTHRVTAIHETLIKTNFNDLRIGDLINLERSLQFNGRLDGHFVQGHVDATAECIEVISKDGSWEYTFCFDKQFAPWIIEKGSICLNGISLTIFNITETKFTVAIIPFTFENTNMKGLVKGNKVNIEFDVLGKYVSRIASLNSV
jgi:riboflavin synthase